MVLNEEVATILKQDFSTVSQHYIKSEMNVITSVTTGQCSNQDVSEIGHKVLLSVCFMQNRLLTSVSLTA